MCSFFLVTGNRQSLLVMPDIKTLGILTFTCTTIEMKETDGPENGKTNISQEIDATGQYYTNTDNVSKFENEDKPMVADNDNYNIKYFPPGPNSDNNKRVSTEITQ